jgi:tRNA modification GTPase
MSSTYVVELTPPGRGAVAVVLVAGPQAVDIVDRLFRAISGRTIRETPLGRVVVGHWGGNDGEELVVCRRDELEIEVHCHGGYAAVAAVVDSLVQGGAIAMPWREWLRSRVSPRREGSSAAQGENIAYRIDAATYAAHAALAEALTERAALILLDQFNGALSNAIDAAIESITAENWPHAAVALDALLKHRELGLHLTTPWRVVLAGPPNVGKSSLINALMGFQRAIVAPTPGTTRDVVTATTAIDGWPVLLADTAGLRETSDELEAAGVELARGALATADLAIVVEEAASPSDEDFSQSLALSGRVIYVRNKIDLVLEPQLGGEDAPARSNMINTSAVTGEGIAELVAAVGAALVPSPPAPREAVPFTTSQVESLVVARKAVQRQHAAAAIESLRSVLAE